MRRFALALVAITVGSGATFAQVAPTAPATETTAKSEASAPPAEAGSKSRAVSAETSAKIGAGMPKFSPPKPAEAAAPAAAPVAEAKEADKPRNTIIRLPRHVVQDRRDPVIKDREILTPKGKLELALKRYPGLRFGSLPFLSNNGIAMLLLEEDLRLERKTEMEDLVELYHYSDPKKGAAMKTEVYRAFTRTDTP